MRRTELVVFVPLAVVTAATGAVGRHDLQAAPKLALVPTLLAGLAARGQLRAPLAVAGYAATCGDWLMHRSGVTEHVDPVASRRWMRLGATAFAIQQIGYAALLRGRGARLRRGPTAAVLAVLCGLAALESQPLGDGVSDVPVLPDPVLTAYGLTLGAMAALAQDARCGSGTNSRIGSGGALFLASDAAIIVRPHLPQRLHAAAEAFVLLTYAAAQSLLIDGLAPAEVTR